MTQKLLAAAISLLSLTGLALAQAPAPSDQPVATAPRGAEEVQRLTLAQAAGPAGGAELQRIVVTGYVIPPR